MAYETVASVVSDAAQLLGLTSQEIATPLASTDPNVRQLLALLKSAGRDLIAEHPWSHLQVEYTFDTVADEDTYEFPADFDRHIDQTQWNRSATMPLGGPLSPEGWQALKALNVASGTQFYFRAKGPRLVLHPVPSSVQTVALEYQSRHWVQQDVDGTRKDAPTLDSDLLLLDGQLLVHRLRRDFLQAKQFDSTTATNAYEDAIANARGNAPAPVLSLNGVAGRVRVLGAGNLPSTGWGG
jgi:hypothetical protein